MTTKEPGQLAFETFWPDRATDKWENHTLSYQADWAAVEAAIRKDQMERDCATECAHCHTGVSHFSVESSYPDDAYKHRYDSNSRAFKCYASKIRKQMEAL